MTRRPPRHALWGALLALAAALLLVLLGRSGADADGWIPLAPAAYVSAGLLAGAAASVFVARLPRWVPPTLAGAAVLLAILGGGALLLADPVSGLGVLLALAAMGLLMARAKE